MKKTGKQNIAVDISNKDYAIANISGFPVLIDYDSIDIVLKHGWNVNKIVLKNKGLYYFQAEKRESGKRQTLKLHRSIMGCKYKDGTSIDHINGNTLDNRKCNLRICTVSENNKNRKIRKDNKSGYRGVYFYKQTNKWCAQIGINYKRITIGYYETIEEAHLARLEAVNKHHGMFARNN